MKTRKPPLPRRGVVLSFLSESTVGEWVRVQPPVHPWPEEGRTVSVTVIRSFPTRHDEHCYREHTGILKVKKHFTKMKERPSVIAFLDSFRTYLRGDIGTLPSTTCVRVPLFRWVPSSVRYGDARKVGWFDEDDKKRNVKSSKWVPLLYFTVCPVFTFILRNSPFKPCYFRS